MKGIAIAAAGAALLGSATASKGMHNHLHKREEPWGANFGYGDYTDSLAPPPTTSERVLPKTSSSPPEVPKPESTSWVDWTTPVVDPAKPSTTWADWTKPVTTTKVVDPEKPSSTWADWTTTSPVVDPAKHSTSWADWTKPVTTTKVVDPEKPSSSTWADWTTTKSTSKVVDPEKPSSTWADWTTTKVADPEKPSSTWADWTTTKVADPEKPSSTWADWTTTTHVADPEKSTSWADWTKKTTTTPVVDGDKKSTSWVDWSATSSDAKPTAPASSSWGEWEEGTSTLTISGTVIKTYYVEPAMSTVTSSVGWSSDGWFGPTWSTNPNDVCTLNVVTSYGAPSWKPTADAVPATTVTVAPTPESSWADWSSVSSSSSAAPAANTWADWSSSAAGAKPSYAVSPAGFRPNGNQWGMTYSPYTNGGGCKDAGTVAKDLAGIAGKGFTTVRVYSTDCSTLKNVGDAARANGLKIILGVFISSTGIPGAQKQVTDIVAWAQWDLVELIVVGNEAVFNGYCSASALAGFISSCAGAFKGAGYTGKVTTTEPLTIWESQGSAFCGVVDVVAANLYAFFNAQTTADKAGALIQAQIGILNGICPGKDAYAMETGWPKAGNCNGAACPSPENQAVAIKGIQSVVGAKVIFFSYENEGWKDPGQFGVEQHWGCADVFNKY